MAARQLTQVYLEPAQKAALQKRAKSKGTKLSEEIRAAVDTYLAGITAEELDVLDKATQEAEKHLVAMANQLKSTNKRLETVFRANAKIRSSDPKMTA